MYLSTQISLSQSKSSYNTMLLKLLTILILVGFAQANVEPEISISTYLDQCINKHNLQREKMLEFGEQITIPVDHPELTKFFVCVFTKIGALENDSLNFNNLKLAIPHFITYRYNIDLDKAKEVTEKINTKFCFDLEQKSNLHVHAMNIRNCLVKESQMYMDSHVP
ncbi:hypothetical protein FQR65_LT07868 [Abscondita terminalis]|nr:hypothetical protein FQR65_LT07868 [Abscondita terminalis]